MDDKLRILAAVKKAWKDRVTTVLVRQGKFANDPQVVANYPGAGDVTAEHIRDLLTAKLPDLPGASLTVSKVGGQQ